MLRVRREWSAVLTCRMYKHYSDCAQNLWMNSSEWMNHMGSALWSCLQWWLLPLSHVLFCFFRGQFAPKLHLHTVLSKSWATPCFFTFSFLTLFFRVVFSNSSSGLSKSCFILPFHLPFSLTIFRGLYFVSLLVFFVLFFCLLQSYLTLSYTLLNYKK